MYSLQRLIPLRPTHGRPGMADEVCKPAPTELENIIESTVACKAVHSMAAERHGAASAVVLRVWSEAADARFIVFHRLGAEGVACPAAYMAYRLISGDESRGAGTVCFISDLYVRPMFRRQGIARQMLRRLTHAQQNGSTCEENQSEQYPPRRWQKVQLHVICDNDPAVRLYLSEGFEQLPVGTDTSWEDRNKRVMEYNCG